MVPSSQGCEVGPELAPSSQVGQYVGVCPPNRVSLRRSCVRVRYMSGLVQVVERGLGCSVCCWVLLWVTGLRPNSECAVFLVHACVHYILTAVFFSLSLSLLQVCRSVWGAIKPPRQASSPLRAHGVHAQPPCTSPQTTTLRC